MAAIAAGTAGFLLIILCDWADARKLPALKIAGTVMAAALIGTGFVVLALSADRFFIPAWVRIVAGLLAGVFFFLLIYSHFFEVAPLLSYTPADGNRAVFSRGTYALVRHPGVLWLLLFHLALAAASGSRLLLAAVPFWNGANLLIVCLEEAIFFPKIFGDAYKEYQRRVPFLVPTPSSFRECGRTIFSHPGAVTHRSNKNN